MNGTVRSARIVRSMLFSTVKITGLNILSIEVNSTVGCAGFRYVSTTSFLKFKSKRFASSKVCSLGSGFRIVSRKLV